ncbi:hypothetical protein [Streptomyces sp. NPDC001820]|uniref:hypothetical protein n=1 Tax=Streptomyces sp. NPDC001820 TaxID=3364613 RepID=UPI003682899A
MTSPMPNTHSLPDRPNLPWGASIASLVVCLFTWVLSWGKAYLINDDLPNFCSDVRRGSFPPEVACVSGNGTVTGANAWWVDPLFFTSGVLSVVFAVLALMVASAGRKR